MDSETRSRPVTTTAFDYTALLGLPFRYGARGPTEFDCYGLVKAYFALGGIELPDLPAAYCDRATAFGQFGDVFSEFPDDRWERVLYQEPQTNDVLALARTPEREAAEHCAVMIDRTRALHVCEGSVVRTIPYARLRTRTRGVYRLWLA